MLRPLALALSLGLAALGAAAPVLAEPLYAVRGVAADDVLNVRTRPEVGAPIVARLPPDATGIAIGPRQGNWIEVTVGGQKGWASARFLVPEAGPTAATATAAQGTAAALTCHGNEPFWSLTVAGDRLEWKAPEATRSLALRARLDDGLSPPRTRALIGGDAKGRVTLVAQSVQCDDTMADTVFPTKATVILEGPGAPSRMLTGCCRAGG